jgi:hypothetical protein
MAWIGLRTKEDWQASAKPSSITTRMEMEIGLRMSPMRYRVDGVDQGTQM